MRLDKYLKSARLAKRRSEAKEALDAGRIECDGRPLKASYQVKVGDRLLIHYARSDLLVRVDSIPERANAAPKGVRSYTVLTDDTAKQSR